MITVIHTDEFGVWFLSLGQGDQDSVGVVVTMLEMEGLSLAYPFSSKIENSQYALRELRPKRGHSPLRVFYAFDPKRQAVLLIGGDKSSDKKFYKRLIKKAEEILEAYLSELKK